MNEKQVSKTIKTLKEQRDAARSEVELLKSTLSTRITEAVEKVASTAQTEVAELKLQVEGLRKKAADFVGDLRVADDKLKVLEKDLELEREFHKITTEKLNDYIDKTKALEAQLSGPEERDIKNLRRRLNEKSTKLDAAEKELHKLRRENLRLTGFFTLKPEERVMLLDLLAEADESGVLKKALDKAVADQKHEVEIAKTAEAAAKGVETPATQG